ncbi:MAG: peptidyl-prolyl cis-trans isomerase [Novosphingobium sp.]
MSLKARAAALLREPLVHFLIAGALVFTALSGRPADPGERRIVVDEAVVTRLVERWTQSFRRPPSQGEIDGLIRDYVRDQVYYREALRLGLDRDDEVVVKRMRNKMVALAAAEAEAREPSEAELQALLDRDPGRYAAEARYDFEQVYLGPDNANGRGAADAAVAALNAGGSSASLGVPSPLPARFTATALGEVAERFGDDFAAGLAGLQVGRWAGLSSGLGLHAVRVTARSVPASHTLAAVRQRLTNDWRAAAVCKAQDEAYRGLLEGYDVVIEKPR